MDILLLLGAFYDAVCQTNQTLQLAGNDEDEMVGWHRRLNGHEFEQAPGDGEGQGGLACCSPWGRKESDTTEQLNNNNYLCV